MAAAVLKPDQACLQQCNQQRPDPRASGARGMARPKPGPGRGAGPVRRDVTPGRWRPWSSSPIKPVSRNATNSDPNPGPVALGAWLDPSLGREEGRGRRKGT